MTQTQPFTIFVEGNIGAGKSTFLKYFDEFKNVDVVQEPVEEWQNLNGSNLLNLMYEDSAKWGFAFQTYTLLLMLQNSTKPSEKKIRIMERSLYSGRYCFIEMMYKDHKIEKAEYDILQKWYQHIEENMNVEPDLIIYLRSSPEIAYHRLIQRGRSEERRVSLEYIQCLHTLHEMWLIENNITVPVLTLNADLSENEIIKQFKSLSPNFQMRLDIDSIDIE